MPTRVQRSRQRLRPTASASCATPCVRAHRYHGTAVRVEVYEKNRLASTCLFLTVTSNTLLIPRRRRESHSTYASGEYTSHHLASHRENSVADQRGGSAWRRTPSPDPREHAHELGEALTEPRSASRPTTPSTLRSDADECPAASSMKKHVLGGRAAAAGRAAVGVALVAGRPFVAEVGGHTCDAADQRHRLDRLPVDDVEAFLCLSRRSSSSPVFLRRPFLRRPSSTNHCQLKAVRSPVITHGLLT